MHSIDKNKEDTINKSLLLNWLYASDKNLPITELKRWLEGNTNAEYTIIKKNTKNHSIITKSIDAL
ncbi:MAG: hypothetical protein NWS20_04165 [Rickettsiaceae bacterium]|jgi:hypothetical protein|nr:hypothetical protein [Rickettsiaceae bacterium]